VIFVPAVPDLAFTAQDRRWRVTCGRCGCLLAD